MKLRAKQEKKNIPEKQKKPRTSMKYRVDAGDKAAEAGLSNKYIRQHGTADDCYNYLLNDVWADKWGVPTPISNRGTKLSAPITPNEPSMTQTTSGEATVKYVPFYFNDFWHDPRMLELDIPDQQRYLFLLVRMMLTGGRIPEDYKRIAKTLEITVDKATKLTRKLKSVGLLVASATGEKLLTLTSNRLIREFERARHLCEVAKNRASKGGIGKQEVRNKGATSPA